MTMDHPPGPPARGGTDYSQQRTRTESPAVEAYCSHFLYWRWPMTAGGQGPVYAGRVLWTVLMVVLLLYYAVGGGCVLIPLGAGVHPCLDG